MKIAEGVSVVTEPEKIIAFVNPKLEQMYGYGPGEMIGMQVDLLHVGSDPRYREIAVALRDRRAWRGEVISVRKDGSRFWIDLSITVFSDGKQDGWLAVSSDITARKDAEDQVKDHQARVISSAKMAALGEMAANIGHEINNPLTIIRATAEDLSDQINEKRADEAVLRRGLDRIEITVERIAKIVRGLRSFAREEPSAPFRRIQIREILSDTLSLCSERLKRHSVQLRVAPVHAAIQIECRHFQVSQILLNLLNNAFDAIEMLDDKWVTVEVRELPQRVELSITDSGKGIPLAIRERMMEPFFTTKSGFKGSGLGLSISKGLAESHHGTLEYDDKSANTRFVLSLPKIQPDAVS